RFARGRKRRAMNDASWWGWPCAPRRERRQFGAAGPAPAPPARRERSRAELIEVWASALGAALSLATVLAPPANAKLLVPMDNVQADHLKAYGLAFWVLQHGYKSEWLLNYRGGSFLFPARATVTGRGAP